MLPRACLCLAVWLAAGVACRSDAAPKKIYVITDLEGISGVYKFAQTRETDTPSARQAREFFMGDLAAVVRGLRDGGATEILVLDGHGNQALLPELMAPGAKYILCSVTPSHCNCTSFALGAVRRNVTRPSVWTSGEMMRCEKAGLRPARRSRKVQVLVVICATQK